MVLYPLPVHAEKLARYHYAYWDRVEPRIYDLAFVKKLWFEANGFKEVLSFADNSLLDEAEAAVKGMTAAQRSQYIDQHPRSKELKQSLDVENVYYFWVYKFSAATEASAKLRGWNNWSVMTCNGIKMRLTGTPFISDRTVTIDWNGKKVEQPCWLPDWR